MSPFWTSTVRGPHLMSRVYRLIQKALIHIEMQCLHWHIDSAWPTPDVTCLSPDSESLDSHRDAMSPFGISTVRGPHLMSRVYRLIQKALIHIELQCLHSASRQCVAHT